MTKNFCDFCHKAIPDGVKMVAAGYGVFGHHHVCQACGSPIVRFLEKYNLEKNEKEKRAEQNKERARRETTAASTF